MRWYDRYDLAQRSYEAEIMDDLSLPLEHIAENYRELESINRWLGGHRFIGAKIKALRKMGVLPSHWRLADFGSGGGDLYRYLYRHFPQSHAWRYYGYDASAAAIGIAQAQKTGDKARFVQMDLLQDWPEEHFHLSCFNLFLHHFTEEEIVNMLRKAGQRSEVILINDLQRNALAYRLFGSFSKLSGLSEISRHDGALSIKRSFTRLDWQAILKQLGWSDYYFEQRWAFRLCLTIYPEQAKY